MSSAGGDQGAGVRGHKTRSGMTLVEVILSAVILGILAILVVNALFYPRLLVVSSALKQQAVNAGTDALEQVFSKSYNSISNGTVSLPDLSGRYSMNGRTVFGTLSVETLGVSEEYKHITVTVNYPNGQNPVVLETYRSPMK
jgi:prepilin-type N-terminal cleavage/methylation domain-containing protein